MSEKKSARGTLNNKSIKDFVTDHLYVPDEHMLVIYHAQFYQNFLLLCMKQSLAIYDLRRKAFFKEHRVKTHCAAFIPNSNYIAYASADGDGLYTHLNVWNYENDSIDSKLTFTFEIVSLKASHRCIIFSSLSSLYVIHFPSLKPIFNDQAGNGFNIIYDISKEGLTLVHSTEIKGEVAIRNFTNRETNKYIAEIRTSSNQLSNRIRRMSTKKVDMAESEEEEIKSEIIIKAHHENVSILRLSPNGYRFVSGSTKGTVLRLYSCLNGSLISQFHVCNALSTIVDINFIAEGNAIVCLNNQNHVKLFHTKMSEEELICQSLRRGKEVYEQVNPKSWLSFLGFLDEELKYERPFSYFNLQSLSGKDIQKAKIKSSHHIGMSEIKEQPHEKQSQIFHHSEDPLPKDNQFAPKEVFIQEIGLNEIINPTVTNSEKSNSIRQSNNMESDGKSNQPPSVRTSSAHKKKSHTNSIKSLVKKQAEIITMKREANLNFRGIIMFENHIGVKILKGKYFYELKYDPFNGGEMMSKSTKLNLLEVLLSKGL